MKIDRLLPLIIVKGIFENQKALIDSCKKDAAHNLLSIDSANIEEIFLLKKEELKSKEIQNLINKSKFSIGQKTYRFIYICWHENLKKTGTFNKLLKFFEEPPKNTLIFLFENSCILPDTIKSRGVSFVPTLNQGQSLKPLAQNDKYEQMRKTLNSYVLGEISLSEVNNELKSNRELAQELLLKTLRVLISRKATYKTLDATRKIITKYNNSNELNLNRFDNILIPIKILLNNDTSNL